MTDLEPRNRPRSRAKMTLQNGAAGPVSISGARTKAAAKGQNTTALIVFGRDQRGKPHASAFNASEAELATKAAGLMGMKVLRPQTDDQRALAVKLPKGRLFGSGRAFVPFVRAGLYESLAAFGGAPLGAQPGAPEPACTASPSPPEANASGTGSPATDKGAPPAPGNPEIEVGSLVLALEGPSEGWFESVVVKVDDDLLTLKWRDWPKLALFVRRRSQVALLPPDSVGA